jgi:hypothetical protein
MFMQRVYFISRDGFVIYNIRHLGESENWIYKKINEVCIKFLFKHICH